MNSASSHTLCVLIADVVGGFRLREKLGGQEAQRAVERCLHRVGRAAEAGKGRVVKASGHELVIAFASAEAAMQAAGEMQQRVAALPPVSGLALAIRIGFQVGVVDEQAGELFGDAVGIAARLSKLATAGQVLTTADTAATLPADLRGQAREIAGQSVESAHGSCRVVEVAWNAAGETRPVEEASAAEHVMPRLRLRHGDQAVVLGPEKSAINFGRDADSGLTISHARASRAHGRIECRDDRYILIDQSTNGTFLTFAGEQEISLRRVEVVLHGKGHFSCGQPAGAGDSELIEFEVLDR